MVRKCKLFFLPFLDVLCLLAKLETVSRTLNTIMTKLDVLVPIFEDQKKFIQSIQSVNSKVKGLNWFTSQ